MEPPKMHNIEYCSTIFQWAENEWDYLHVDKRELTKVPKDDPMVDESKMLQETTPRTKIDTCFQMQDQLPELLLDVVMVPNTTLEIQDQKVEEVQLKNGQSRHKKRKIRNFDDRVQVEFKKGDQVILYHHKSNMFSGRKSTRWSGRYLLNRALKNDSVKLWHKNSGYFMVRKIRLKHYTRFDQLGRVPPILLI